MKKIFILLVLIGCLSMHGFSQPTALITVENPRIDGNQFLFDVYFERTNDDPLWYGTGFPYPAQAGLAFGSWWFKANVSALSSPTITYVDPTYFQGNYNFAIAMNVPIGSIAVTQSLMALPPAIPLNVMFHAFTVSCTIGTTTVNSLVISDVINTGLMGFGGASGFPFSVTESYLSSGCDIVLNHKCWDGSANGLWDDANNWSPVGMPIATDDIIYPNNPANEYAGKTVNSHSTVQNLRVNHFAEMSIPQSNGLTVTGNIDLMGGPRNIICESGANSGTLSSAFIPNTINYSAYSIEDGHIEVHRTLYYYPSDVTEYYMHQVAAPVSGVILDDWDMIVLSTYAFEWQTATQEWYNIYAPWRSTPSGYGFVVSIYGENTPSTRDLIFYDNLVLNNHTVNFDQILIDSIALIGNPYTAPVDWVAMRSGQPFKAESRIWDPSLGSGIGAYVTYVAGTGGNLSARYIQPGQSFFVKASGPASSFAFDLSDRVSNIEPYLKNSEFPNLLRLYNTVGENDTSCGEVYIRFKDAEGVSISYDEDHDGVFMDGYFPNFSNDIYTYSSDGRRLSVDARPMLVGDDVSVPLHFKPSADGVYRIVADEESINSFAPSISIMLEDTFEPQQDWIDMRAEGYYEFDADKYDPRDRFVVHFYDLEFGIEDGVVEPIRIFSDRTDAFIINKSEQLIKEIHVYDITGNLIASKSTVNNASTRIYVSDEVGYYIVKVITDKAVYSEKVLITK